MKFGIVGTNFISDWFAEAAGRVDGVSLAAVCSRSEARGRAFAERNRVERVYTDYEAMLCSDIDAVYIASPTFMHGTQAILAMERGKHVLCEKMMAASLAVAERMKECAKRAGVILLEAMRPDFDPATEIIREAMTEIGRIRRAHLEYCQYSSRYDRFKAGEVLNAFDPYICNSALQDIGIYPLHMALRLFGRPKGMRASSVLLQGGFEGMGNITLEYADMLCEVVYSKITDTATHSVIEGEGGSVIFDRVNVPGEIILHKRGEEPRWLEYTPSPKNMNYEIEAFRDMTMGLRDAAEYLRATMDSIDIVTQAYHQTGAIKYMNPEYMV